MPDAASRSSGYTLVEVLFVLLLLSLLAALAVPRLDRRLQQLEARAALDQVAAEIFHARTLALRNGAPVELRFAAEQRCVRAYRVQPSQGPAASLRSLGPFAERFCVRHTGTGRLVFNSRGVVRPTGLTLRVDAGGREHRLVVSSAGRVLRPR